MPDPERSAPADEAPTLPPSQSAEFAIPQTGSAQQHRTVFVRVQAVKRTFWST
jgi:hypothetical protein